MKKTAAMVSTCIDIFHEYKHWKIEKKTLLWKEEIFPKKTEASPGLVGWLMASVPTWDEQLPGGGLNQPGSGSAPVTHRSWAEAKFA